MYVDFTYNFTCEFYLQFHPHIELEMQTLPGKIAFLK